ncbi:MAG: bifunctional diaminohydroxyphosphoribosylaminopyrimidine deaminase/5-amino-6-(5-phosphoribosylamino)uracil reductase RibD [Planctomycetes bacterium]|nr:bifunctional diaminohydroxyphosphoribosylaminopyrimidine deaminase/5-amino-6-(5-phosphoribosylamino)uracil reductase RibD [Planctomycetota bacterium]
MENRFTEQDCEFMGQAVALARNGQGRVAPNPPVGCVIVRDGLVVGRGWHDRHGDLHAETAALRDAGDWAVGATAYVTLSPCTTQGLQPPCTDALIAAKIGRVVVAATDPNRPNADGIAVLRAAGIVADGGLLREEAEYVAKGFFKMMRHGLPWVRWKYAISMDGKIAATGGDSRWVSGPESRALVMDMRSRCDAVMVGIGTVLADDPLLTVREPAWSTRGGAARHRQPKRVVVDSNCRIPPDAAMLRDENGGKVVVLTVFGRNPERVDRLRRAGVTVLATPARNGRVSLPDGLAELGKIGVNDILVEGGGELAAGLLENGLVDELDTFIAPKIVGGREAPGPVAGHGITRMADATRLTVREWRRVGDDIYVNSLIARNDPADRSKPGADEEAHSVFSE